MKAELHHRVDVHKSNDYSVIQFYYVSYMIRIWLISSGISVSAEINKLRKSKSGLLKRNGWRTILV